MAEDEANSLMALVRELCGYFEKVKKTSLRIAIIQTIEKLIQPLEFVFKASRPSWEMNIWTDVRSRL